MRQIFLLAIMALGAATITAMGKPLAMQQENDAARLHDQAMRERNYNLEHSKPAAATPPAPESAINRESLPLDQATPASAPTPTPPNQ